MHSSIVYNSVIYFKITSSNFEYRALWLNQHNLLTVTLATPASPSTAARTGRATWLAWTMEPGTRLIRALASVRQKYFDFESSLQGYHCTQPIRACIAAWEAWEWDTVHIKISLGSQFNTLSTFPREAMFSPPNSSRVCRAATQQLGRLQRCRWGWTTRLREVELSACK